MKKLSAIILTLVFVLALSACKSNDAAVGAPSGETSTTSIQNEQPAATSESEIKSEESQTQSQPDASTPSNQEGTAATSKPASDKTQSQTSAQSDVKITRDEAINIALKEAGVKKAEVRDLEAELDRERGEKVWEVDFEKGNMEYSYDVDAQTGKITERETERD